LPQQELANWYVAADVTVVPSYNESFGLVAVEAQACGTPVVAARVGGLTTAVADGVSGVLIDGHHPTDYACVLADLMTQPRRRAALSAGALAYAQRFGWSVTAARLIDAYAGAMEDLAAPVAMAVGR
jgi:D-inositol-3-phosphate glycosyltransferase